MNYDVLAAEMRRLSIVAGEKIMEIYGSDDFNVQTKTDESPVTEADKAADKIISDGLKTKLPNAISVLLAKKSVHE